VEVRTRHYLKITLWTVITAFILTLLVFTRKPCNPPPKKGKLVANQTIVVYSPGYRISFYGIEKLHPFDIAKYDRIADHLVENGILEKDDFQVPKPANVETLSLAHNSDYLDSLYEHETLSRALEVPIPKIFPRRSLESRILDPFRRATGGTIEAARAALKHGMAINLGGGFHHAHPDMGHGFCIYNDVAVAIRVLRKEGFSGKILILDTDAHQGDGNHAFFTDDPTVFTFSMQQENIFPAIKIPGNLEAPLQESTGDDELLKILEQGLMEALDESRPELVFHVAGADVLHDDQLAGLSITTDGLVRRDLLVKEKVKSRGIALVYLLAGGYGPSAAEAQAKSIEAMLKE